METSSSSPSTPFGVTSTPVTAKSSIVLFNHHITIKLDDPNYLLWRRQVMHAIQGHGLHKFIFAAIGNEVSEHEKMHCILEGLLKEYESFVTSINLKSEPVSIWELEAYLLGQEIRLDKSSKVISSTPVPSANVASLDSKDKSNSSSKQNNNSNFGGRQYNSNNNSFNNNNRGGRGGRSNGNRPFVMCQVCGRTVHIASYCYNRFDSSYQMTTEQYHHNFKQKSSGSMTAMLATLERLYDAAWFLDYGVTNHVTTYYNNMMQGTEYNGPEQLHMGNGNGLVISNVGKSIVTSSFKPNIALKLNNLLHIPSVTKKLATKTILLKGYFKPNGPYSFDDFQLKHLTSSPQSTSSASPQVHVSVSNTESVVSSALVSVSNNVPTTHATTATTLELGDLVDERSRPQNVILGRRAS
ncbi:Retrovirus-related Pol polyprotein from transposon TNT 1-94 [Senna tora]|uniref:Retrovirus-related Pol polyprotein from transposon TNT 1-94 n=1 Tax=Senna tora TaxID=362788 RepID=A0A835CGS5_9FABA|nr:Retrovirus-related Pol polyprotein from transposon TNT 1-94 [Senna tora]